MDQNIIASSWSTSIFLWDLSDAPEKYTVISFVSKYLPVVLNPAQKHSLKPIYSWLNTSWQPFKKSGKVPGNRCHVVPPNRKGSDKFTLHKMEPAANIISLAKNPCQAKPGLTNSYKTYMTMRLMSQSGSATVALWGTDNLLDIDFFIG